jgi:hypothetical protein
VNLPFSIGQFLKVFKEYNLHIYPFQFVLNMLAIACIILIFAKPVGGSKFIFLILSFFWLWMGIVYHLIFFTRINPAAYFFGLMFIIQGGLFFFIAFTKKNAFKFKPDIYGIAAIAFIIFSLVVYPLLSYWQHRIYPSAPTFGLPCPTTIFTFGILLLMPDSIPFYLVIIPFLWSSIGSLAAFKLGMHEDFGLLISAILTAIMLTIKKRNVKRLR